jgi:hypothetical protein
VRERVARELVLLEKPNAQPAPSLAARRNQP